MSSILLHITIFINIIMINNVNGKTISGDNERYPFSLVNIAISDWICLFMTLIYASLFKVYF